MLCVYNFDAGKVNYDDFNATISNTSLISNEANI